MGITKQYLRYEPEAVFGVVGSSNAQSVFVKYKKTHHRYIATAACENVNVWDSRTGELVFILPGSKHSVTVLEAHPQESVIAVGYIDGSIRCFDIPKRECILVFTGHKSAISSLAYDHIGMRLVSGGKDTEIVIWDVVNEAGLFRLKGHKGVVTCCQFMKERNVLITSSKDMFLKFWDLDTKHCFKTLVGHRTEVWCFVYVENNQRLITGSGDSELRVYQLEFMNTKNNENVTSSPKKIKMTISNDEGVEPDADLLEDDGNLSCTKIGTILRQGKERVHSLKMDQKERILACHGSDFLLEIFVFCNQEELKKRLQKKQRKERKRQHKSLDEGEEQTSTEVSLELTDQIKRINPIKAGGRIRSFDIFMKEGESAKLVLLLSNNSLEWFSVWPGEKEQDFLNKGRIKLPGHRSDVRTVSFSSDCSRLLSASGESLKIWNRHSQSCVGTMDCEYALSSLFAPGDRFCFVGTKPGKIQIFDTSSCSLLYEIEAHQAEVWSIVLTGDLRGIVSGSADKEVKFWDFDLVKNSDDSGSKTGLTITHQRTLKMTEDVLCVRVSKDSKFLAVSLLDNTVKIFYMDTLKFFLSLYGHKFPVLCMDISDDATLIVTGSADKNIKIWGMDFGDCHKSIFAHDDSIMCIQFIPRTHMFFSAGKDKRLKQWDADNFQKILTLEGHQGEIWALAVGSDGKSVLTASHDKSLRLWEKTEEPLILEEEQEIEREAEYEQNAVGYEPVIPGETNKETGLAGKKSTETIAAAEKIIEAIDIFNEEKAVLEEYQSECKIEGKELPKPKQNPLMEVYKTTCPFRFVLEVLKRIRSSELEEALLVLPFSYVCDFLYVLGQFLEKKWELELSCRCLFLLLRVHCNQIMSSHILIPVMDRLRSSTVEAVERLRNTIGFNLAGLEYLQQEIDDNEVVLFAEASEMFKQKRKRQRKKEKLIFQMD